MTDRASLIQDLLDPEALPDETESVSLVQTHISMVFLGTAFVYKIKKPVDFGFLDFTTLKKREFFCHQEVRLNRRLAGDVYTGVLPVIYDGRRHRIGKGRGEIVDFAVRMRKIPQERLMKSLFDRGELRQEHLQEVARVLARFHRDADRSAKIDRFGRPDVFRVNTDENFQQTERFIDRTIRGEDFHLIRQWTEDFYREMEGLFQERIKGGKVRDCHGDLHMEHICFTERLAIIDCIEFNDRMRYSDTLADIAFLLMDLEYRGGRDLADRLWTLYGEQTGDKGLDRLLTFYKVYRAYVRGKVNSFQLDDHQMDESQRAAAARRASRYFELAKSYLE